MIFQPSTVASGRMTRFQEQVGRPDAAGSAETRLVLDDVSLVRGETTILDAVSLAIGRGEFFTLLGPSGCGKTSLLRLIAGFDAPDRGSIVLAGEDLADRAAAQRPINTVFQNYALFPHLSVADNVAFGLRMLRRPASEVSTRVEEMLALVRLSDLGGRGISQLSGGQQQRVALARALAPAPKLLLLDEPFSALDQKLRHEMRAEMKRIQRELGMTFVFVTHDQEEALALSDRIAVMARGRVVQCDSPQALYDMPASRFVAEFLGEANFLTGRLRAVAADRACVEIADGQIVSVPLGKEAPGPGEVTLMIRPEHVGIGPQGGMSLRAQLVERSFLGADHVLTARLSNGTAIRLRSRDAELLRDLMPGDRFPVSLAQHHLRILAEDRQ